MVLVLLRHALRKMSAKLLKVFSSKLAVAFDFLGSIFAPSAHVVHPGEEPELKRFLEPFSTMQRRAKILEIADSGKFA